MIEIVVNGETKQVEAGLSLKELLSKLGFQLDGTAAAVNEQVVPKSTFDSFKLENGMKVDIFSLVAGG